MTDAMLQYAAGDVIYLHKIKDALHKMLVRENRLELFESCMKFLPSRIKLDEKLFTEDIFAHWKMNKDIKVAKQTINKEIKALKKLLASFNRPSQFSKAVIFISKIRG